MTLAVGVPGGATTLLIDDVAGLASKLRQGIAEIAGVEPSRVSVTAVQLQEAVPNGTWVPSDPEVQLNATVAANNGTLAQSNASLVWATPTAEPAANFAAWRVLLGSNDVCVTFRTFNVTNATRTRVSLVLDVSGLQFVNLTDPASAIAAMLIRSIEGPDVLRNFTRAWTECTGVDAAAIQLLEAPAVRTGLRPSPSSLAFSAGAAAALFPANEVNLPALIVVGLLVLAALLLACCCCNWAVVRVRQQGLPPLPALHVSLPGDRVVLLPLHWGSVLASEGKLGAASLRARTRRHHALLLGIPAEAPCRVPLGLHNDSLNDHVGLPVTIMEPAAGAGSGGKEELRPVRWYSDGKCGDDSGRDAPLYSDGWVVSCPSLMALEAPRSSSFAPPARAVVAVRAATFAERQLVLRGGDGATRLPVVPPGAVLTSSELARLLHAAEAAAAAGAHPSGGAHGAV